MRQFDLFLTVFLVFAEKKRNLNENKSKISCIIKINKLNLSKQKDKI